MASENPEFGTTLACVASALVIPGARCWGRREARGARRLNQSRASAVIQSNLIAITFDTAEARRLNWALESPYTV